MVSCILLITSISYASDTYTEIGYSDTSFLIEDLRLNDVDTLRYLRGLSGFNTSPALVGDLDGNGTNEIVVFDGETIRLYKDRNLQIVDSVNIQSKAQGNHKYNMIYDIDGDGYLEVLTLSKESRYLEIFEYNGTLFYNQTTIDLHPFISGSDAGQKMFTCKDTDDCFAVGSKYDVRTAVGTTNYVYAISFNSQKRLDWHNITASAGMAYCFSSIPYISIADYNTDGRDDYIFNFLTHATSTEMYLKAYTINHSDVNKNITINNEKLSKLDTTRVYSVNDMTPFESCLDTGKPNYFTSPTVFDFDGSPSNGLEIIIGAMEDNDEFKIISYLSTGEELDDYPEIVDSDGRIISNVIRANVFDESGENDDVCVLGYEEIDQRLNLLCASEQMPGILGFGQSREFFLDDDIYYNVTDNAYSYAKMIHGVQAVVNIQEGKDTTEILSPLGIFRIDYSEGDLTPIWNSPFIDPIYIPVDPEKSGRMDIIGVTQTNLWYIDDGYTKSGARIDKVYVNPTVGPTWKVNTSVEVRVQASDPDLDPVSVRAILYYNTSNKQDSGWSANFSSGTYIPLGIFTANVTTNTGVLQILAKDTSNSNDLAQTTIPFSVGVAGIEYGDGYSEIIINATEPGEVNITVGLNESGNIITRSVNYVATSSGLSSFLFWLVLMFCLGLTIFFTPMPLEGLESHKLGVLMFFEIFMIVIGSILGIVPVVWIITLSVLSLLPVGIYIRKMMTGA